MKRTANETTIQARELRRTMTLPEGLLWQILRKRPGGFKFRRQHPLTPYVLDFYCPAAKLVIEIDGSVHSMGDRPAHDARRDAWLREQGLRVIRFDAADVMNDSNSVVLAILRLSAEQLPLPHASDGPPPHAKRGEELS
jgi:very-short-patch-repair endonuclease